MPTPFPSQITGRDWLATRQYALLADEPRVGKTGAALMASRQAGDEKVLVVTTASGRPVWQRALREWHAPDDTSITGWPTLANAEAQARMLSQRWDRLILDESHYAKNFDAARTRAVYGDPQDDGAEILFHRALVVAARGVWCLTGTPIPNAPNDLYPMMRVLCPERLEARDGMPDVLTYGRFVWRYCVVKIKKQGHRRIPVVVAGRNLEELHERLGGFILRRTQADVGIRQPVYELAPLEVSAGMLRAVEGDADRTRILKAARDGDTRALEMHLGPMRRMTGAAKVQGVAAMLADEFDSGLGKIVVAFWHREVGDALEVALSKYGVVRLDGSTSAKDRASAEGRFRDKPRVFLGQIQAAGEAIDLSPAAELLFVETSMIPKDMLQMSLRVTNYAQARIPRVRVATLAGSIDEAVEGLLLRKWSAIREVLK